MIGTGSREAGYRSSPREDIANVARLVDAVRDPDRQGMRDALAEGGIVLLTMYLIDHVDSDMWRDDGAMADDLSPAGDNDGCDGGRVTIGELILLIVLIGMACMA